MWATRTKSITTAQMSIFKLVKSQSLVGKCWKTRKMKPGEVCEFVYTVYLYYARKKLHFRANFGLIQIHTKLILIYMMVLCTQVNKMYVIATLSVYPHRAGLKNMPSHGGIRTYDLWNASPMLCQLSYAVRSVRVYDISELSLVPSIPM